MSLAFACLGISCHSRQGGTGANRFQGPINAAGSSSASTILIVPTSESDEAVQQKIHHCADNIRALITGRFPDRKLKILTDREALEQDLSHSSVIACGTLIGEETGGCRECFGDCPSFTMPNSGLTFGVSTKRFYAPIPKPDDASRGTVPDVAITEDGLAPFVDSIDPELAFVLDLVAGPGM